MGVYRELEGEFDFDIVEEFLSHYSFMVEALERLIIDLSKREKYSKNIEEIFRIFHNIKSASGYLKLTPVNKLVTLGEEILEECRRVEGEGSEELINWLIAVSDQLTLYKEDLESDKEEFSKISPNIIKVPTKFVK
jgi:two-component system chemotaxis sensor kinase CheA